MKKVLIIGAGVAGTDVARDIKLTPQLKMKVVGYIDDDKNKLGRVFEGSKVLGNSNKIYKIVKSKSVNEIIIAIPSAQGDRINNIVNIAVDMGVPHKIVPRVREIIEGRAFLSNIRKVDIQDLLGRPVVKDDVSGLMNFFKDKKVLVTGAAGSIGSELCSQILSYRPKKLIIFDIWENGVFDLKQKFDNLNSGTYIDYAIGNIQDLSRLKSVFSKYKPDYVFHAAAYKHVPLMEDNPIEALKNNIIGTYNVATISMNLKVKKFVLVSTDKAADPKSVMGMTKFFAEKIVESLNFLNTKGKSIETRFITVRFGNVLNSNGSVIPIFRKQIENGGPVTVTDKRMTRYFMTIPEACGLILKSAFLGKGGELFVLDMGKPMSILDLAKKMIRLSGFIPDKDIKIKYMGIRKGEKLVEKLFTNLEKLDTTEDGKIFVSHRHKSSIVGLSSIIESINNVIKNGKSKDLLQTLKRIILKNNV